MRRGKSMKCYFLCSLAPFVACLYTVWRLHQEWRNLEWCFDMPVWSLNQPGPILYTFVFHSCSELDIHAHECWFGTHLIGNCVGGCWHVHGRNWTKSSCIWPHGGNGLSQWPHKHGGWMQAVKPVLIPVNMSFLCPCEFYLSSSIIYKNSEVSRSVIELKLEFIGTPLGPNKLQTLFQRWWTCVFLSIFTCEGHAAILCLYKQHSPYFCAQFCEHAHSITKHRFNYLYRTGLKLIQQGGME